MNPLTQKTKNIVALDYLSQLQNLHIQRNSMKIKIAEIDAEIHSKIRVLQFILESENNPSPNDTK